MISHPFILPFGFERILQIRLAEKLQIVRHKRAILLEAVEIRMFDAAIQASELESTDRSANGRYPNPVPSPSHSGRRRRRHSSNQGRVAECMICCEEGVLETGAPCGHVLCGDCKRGIIRAAREEGRNAVCHICRTPY